MTITEQDIVLQLKGTDINKPVQYLYNQYFEAVITMICFNGGTEDDGADIFQEAVLSLIEKVKTGSFRGESSIKTYLMAIARNQWLHELRTRGRRSSREVNYSDTGEKETEIESRLFAKPETGVMEEIFEAVGETCKKILSGFYYEDLSMKELLERFDYENEQVLRNRKSKCMKKLKELLITNPQLSEKLKTLTIYG